MISEAASDRHPNTKRYDLQCSISNHLNLAKFNPSVKQFI